MNDLKLKPIEIENPVITLSTGYGVEFEDEGKGDPIKKTLEHLVNAIIGERIITEKNIEPDKMVEAVLTEVTYVVQHADKGLLSLLLAQFLYADVFKRVCGIERKIARQRAKELVTQS